VLDERGAQLLSRRIVNDPQAFLELLAGIDGESKVALEATYGWEWLADVLEEAGYELHPAHPLRTKAIASARVKTDAVDARTLAHLLRADLLPEAYIASCAISCGTGWRSRTCARRSSSGSGRSSPSTASNAPKAICSAPAACASSRNSSYARVPGGGSTACCR